MTDKTTATEAFVEITGRNEKLAEQIYLELNSRLNEAETDNLNWAHVGTMDHVEELLDRVAGALGLREVA